MSSHPGCLALVFSLSAVLPALAQLSTASINGTIRDSTGSVIPDAEVLLHHAETNVDRRSRSNEAGLYVFLNIPPGAYTMEASKQGFRKNMLQQFTLVVNQTATFDISLSVGSVEQSVTVEAVGAEVQSSTAELGAAVTRRQVVDLPLNGRNFTQLLSLTPGVAPVSVSQNAGGWVSAPIGQFTFPSVNGQTNRSNFFMMDGVHNHAVYVSVYAVPPIIDAIQEFKVNSHNDQAEFGGATGGIVNVVTKSGTNEPHGALWEYLRNDAFDARNFFLPAVTPFKQHMFGVTAGGPVVLPKLYNGKNRTFFFLGYQGFRFRRSAQTLFRIPTEANLRGDLSDEVRQVFDPFTTRANPAGSGFVRDPFPRNQIPASRIDPGLLLYARTTLPEPTFTGVADRNALDPTPFRQTQEEYTARVDQNIGNSDFLWFRWSGRWQDTDSSGGRPALSNINENRSWNRAMSWVHTFDPSMVLQAQVADVRVKNPMGTKFRSLSANFARDVGLSDQFASNFINVGSLIPGFTVADFFSGGEGGILASKPVDIQQFKANVSKIRGSHTFKFGGELNQTTHFNDVTQIGVGFTAVQTSNPQSPGNSGSALASYLLNVPDRANRRNTRDSTRWGGVLGFFFQDQWKATPKLTVNLGFRYDRTWRPPYGRPEDGNLEVGSLDLNRGVYLLQTSSPSCEQRRAQPCIPTPGGVLPANVEVSPTGKIYKNWTDNWQPRVGLAYRVNQNMAVRAGFGIFFESWAALTQSAQNYSGTWPSVATQLAENLNVPRQDAPTPTIKAGNPFPTGLFPAPTPFEQVQWYMDPNAKNGYSMQWNFGLQQQLDSSTVLTANYVGSGTRRLNLGGIYNVALTPGPGNPRLRQPFPYIAPTFYDRSWGRSNYHAFQFLLDKKYTNGFAYMVSYTWSKAIDIGCSGWFGVEGCSVQDPYNFNRDRSVAGFDLTHVLSVNWVYELPIGKGKALQTGSRFGDYVLGNWQLNGIMTIRSGLPYTLLISGDSANTGNSNNYLRLNQVGEPKLSDPTPGEWFRRAAFQAPAPFTFGDVGRNTLRSDWFRNFDISVFRQFPLWSEVRRLEFRAEAFNTFNTPTFGVPVNNLSSPNFGRVLGQGNSPRQLQLGLKLLF